MNHNPLCSGPELDPELVVERLSEFVSKAWAKTANAIDQRLELISVSAEVCEDGLSQFVKLGLVSMSRGLVLHHIVILGQHH